MSLHSESLADPSFRKWLSVSHSVLMSMFYLLYSYPLPFLLLLMFWC